MKKLLEILSEEMGKAFEAAGYDATLGRVTISNRPDLCEYQCNGAMAGAKQYKKAPIMIANAVAEQLADTAVFSQVTAVAPGFLNLKLSDTFLSEYVKQMSREEKFGLESPEHPKTIVIDYGGPNVAKPLHVGHLRSAVIGEAVKRMERFAGHKVIGDVHLGDWGLQMGLIITELQERKPELPYFDESFTGEYPKEAPFTLSELEEIYPTASGKSKVDEEFKAKALQATADLQQGKRGYRAIWKHIMDISIADLKKNYENLKVDFDLWYGESDSQKYIPEMVEKMKRDGYAYVSNGALVVDVAREDDKKEIPPCMILKSDGAAMYDTTDLATILQRTIDFQPDSIIYVVDKRQELHFEQVFRCARKTGQAAENTELKFLGFGTMNGKDGKPFKTREGGVMRLSSLISQITDQMYEKISGNEALGAEEAKTTAAQVALAALKYGDLSNQASKDYVFDIDKFISFEGDTGPYILYTIVRIKSILNKYREQGGEISMDDLTTPSNASEKDLYMQLAQFNSMLEAACEELAPHKVCAYIYDLANAFNRFYHETRILTEEDAFKKAGWIALLALTKDILECCIDLLGFSAPEKM
ncbi:MAG: arginine--tRNA ligase [Acetatifactor sp.]